MSRFAFMSLPFSKGSPHASPPAGKGWREILIGACTALALTCACTPSGTEQVKTAPQPSTPPETASTTQQRELNLAIWAAYLSPEIQEAFTKETGIKLNVSNYVSNEELLAKLQAGASGIDVCVPSDYMVEVMIKTDLLQPLDLKQIPNVSGLDPQVMHQEFDPENRYSLPYTWITSGIAVNTELYKKPIKSWKDLLTQKDLAGKFSLLDDVREVTGAALKIHGYSLNSTDKNQLEKAKATLREARERIKMFRSDTIDPLVNKEIAAAQAFSTDALQAAQKSGGKIRFILPAEGGTRTIDNMVIPKGAKNLKEAHELINYLLSSKANLSFVKTMFGGPVVKSVKTQLPPVLQKDPALFPPPAQLRKLERLKDLGPATRLYDRLWTELKAE